MSTKAELIARQLEPITTRSDIESKSVREISAALNALLADVFTLYLKTKNFHRHMSGPHFRDFPYLFVGSLQKLCRRGRADDRQRKEFE